jgi:subtilisin family serine protease
LIDDAINSAIQNGRGGKGCIVVATAGNNRHNYVNFPARKHNVISVGALQSDAEK